FVSKDATCVELPVSTFSNSCEGCDACGTVVVSLMILFLPFRCRPSRQCRIKWVRGRIGRDAFAHLPPSSGGLLRAAARYHAADHWGERCPRLFAIVKTRVRSRHPIRPWRMAGPIKPGRR